MGRVCAWCGAMLRGISISVSVSHALCDGCLEDLRESLPSNGMHVGDLRLQRGG